MGREGLIGGVMFTTPETARREPTSALYCPSCRTLNRHPRLLEPIDDLPPPEYEVRDHLARAAVA